MTVAENILFAAVGTAEEKSRKLKENLSRFQLDGLENAYPSELSGGQQQRVSFARVLTSHAEILLLDEPFSALDSWLKWQLELELAEVFKIYGAAILVSHDRGEVYRLADKVAVMHNGAIGTLDSKHEVFKHPKTLAATILTGCKNISPAKKISDDKIFAEDWQLELTAKNIPDNLKFVGIRAHDLESRADFGENTFAMEIVQVIEDTSRYIVMIRANGGKLTTTAAMTAAFHVNTKFMSNCSKNFPIVERLPNSNSKKNPTTVGGKTIGNIITASTRALPRLRLLTKYAKNIPAKNVITVATAEVFSVIISGLNSISITRQNNFIGREVQTNHS